MRKMIWLLISCFCLINIHIRTGCSETLFSGHGDKVIVGLGIFPLTDWVLVMPEGDNFRAEPIEKFFAGTAMVCK